MSLNEKNTEHPENETELCRHERVQLHTCLMNFLPYKRLLCLEFPQKIWIATKEERTDARV